MDLTSTEAQVIVIFDNWPDSEKKRWEDRFPQLKTKGRVHGPVTLCGGRRREKSKKISSNSRSIRIASSKFERYLARVETENLSDSVEVFSRIKNLRSVGIWRIDEGVWDSTFAPNLPNVTKVVFTSLTAEASLCLGWEEFFQDEDQQKFLAKTENVLTAAGKNGQIIYPPVSQVFRIFQTLRPGDIKVLILGQDPYHDGSANGIAFSNVNGKAHSPSLRNIFTELKNDGFKGPPPQTGDLSSWVENGVFLLNTALTVVSGTPESHLLIWKPFTVSILEFLNFQKNSFESLAESAMVCVLWGRKAQAFKSFLTGETIEGVGNRLMIETAHPSPLSATNFFGTKPFSKVNNQLKKWGVEEVDWNLS